MWASWRIPVAAALMLTVVGACSAERILTVDDEGSQVELSLGEEFEVVLPGNPSTGYGWTLTETTPGVIGLVDEPRFEPGSDLIGAPGEYHFRFVARQTGTSPLVMLYERPFEEVEPLDTFEIEVLVD